MKRMNAPSTSHCPASHNRPGRVFKRLDKEREGFICASGLVEDFKQEMKVNSSSQRNLIFTSRR